MPTPEEEALNALPLTEAARQRALARRGQLPDLKQAMRDSVAAPEPVLGRDLPSEEREARRLAQEKADADAYAARRARREATGEPNLLIGTPAALGGAPIVEPEAPTPPPASTEQPKPAEPAPAQPATTQQAFDPYAPRNAGPRLPMFLGAQRQGPVQVTQDQLRTGVATPDEQFEGEQRIERMGQAEGEIAAAQQERAFEAAEYDRGAAEQSRRAIESQQIAEEEKFLLDLSEKQENIDQLREKRSAVPKGERKIEGFWDNAAGWLAVLGGENGAKVIDEIANKEIVKYDRDRALFDDEIRGQAEDFDRILGAQPSRRAALELQKTVKFTQIARRLDQMVSAAGSDEEKIAIQLQRDHAAARAQEARLKWRQAYGDVAVTQVSRTTAQPVTSRLTTPTGIGEARKSEAEERFMRAMAGDERQERGRQAVIAGEAVPTTGPVEETVPDRETRAALGLPEPKPVAKGVAARQAPAPQVQKEAPPETGRSLAAQEGEDAAAHFDRIAQDPAVRNFLQGMTKKYEAAGVPPGRAWIRALNDASGGNYYGEPSASGDASDLKRAVRIGGQTMFATDAQRAQAYEIALDGVANARDGIADWNEFANNSGRKFDEEARSKAQTILYKFNGLMNSLANAGVLSKEERESRMDALPNPAALTDFTQINEGLAKAWAGLADLIEQRIQGRLFLDPEARYPAARDTGFQRTE